VSPVSSGTGRAGQTIHAASAPPIKLRLSRISEYEAVVAPPSINCDKANLAAKPNALIEGSLRMDTTAHVPGRW
jgi:hypothetical protein